MWAPDGHLWGGGLHGGLARWLLLLWLPRTRLYLLLRRGLSGGGGSITLWTGSGCGGRGEVPSLAGFISHGGVFVCVGCVSACRECRSGRARAHATVGLLEDCLQQPTACCGWWATGQEHLGYGRLRMSIPRDSQAWCASHVHHRTSTHPDTHDGRRVTWKIKPQPK